MQVTANAMRVQRHRERRRGGLKCFQIEVDEVATVDMLVIAKLLHPEQADDDGAITAALERLIEIFCQEKSI